MIKIFLNFILSRKYLIWLIVGFLLIFVGLSPLLNSTIRYLNDINIESTNLYLVNTLFLPNAYQFYAILANVVVDVSFIGILIYPILQILSYFFIEVGNISLLKTGRLKFINCIFVTIVITAFVINFIYYLNINIWWIINMHKLLVDISVIQTLVYKCCFSIVIMGIFVLSFLLFSNSFISYLISIVVYVVFNIFVNVFSLNYDGVILKYNYFYLIIFLMSLMFALIYILSIKMIVRKDI